MDNGLFMPNRGGGSNARLGGRELTLLYGFNQYTLLQNRDNSGLLGTPVYCSLKLGGRCPPNAQVGGGGGGGCPPLPPLWSPPCLIIINRLCVGFISVIDGECFFSWAGNMICHESKKSKIGKMTQLV